MKFKIYCLQLEYFRPAGFRPKNYTCKRFGLVLNSTWRCCLLDAHSNSRGKCTMIIYKLSWILCLDFIALINCTKIIITIHCFCFSEGRSVWKWFSFSATIWNVAMLCSKITKNCAARILDNKAVFLSFEFVKFLFIFCSENMCGFPLVLRKVLLFYWSIFNLPWVALLVYSCTVPECL